MTIYLLANVGNHDLKVTNWSVLPDQIDRRPRPLGEFLLKNVQKYQDVIELPLIEPSLTWIKDREGCDIPDINVILFASSQTKDLADPEEYAKDTQPVAEVIKEFLFLKYQIPNKQIRISIIEGNPADYVNMLNFYQTQLDKLVTEFVKLDDDRIYIEVAGGTPAMTSMLIVTGTEFFGQAVTVLYKDRLSDTPTQINIAQVLFARKMRQTIEEQIKLYAYATASETLKDNGRLVLPNEDKRTLVLHVLNYADRRLAFDYDRARKHLQDALPLTLGGDQEQLRAWLRELREPHVDMLLAELIYSAHVKDSLGDYADLTQRLFRFQEAILRYMAEQIGMEYSDEKTKLYVKTEWRTNQPELDKFLREYHRDNTGKEVQKPINIDTSNRPLNRYNLGAIVEYFVTNTDEWAHWKDPTMQIFRLSSVADLRNKGISGHGFEGIGKQDIEREFGEDMDALFTLLESIFTNVFETSLGDNPYDIINKRLLEWLDS